jgi:hypothetical protein
VVQRGREGDARLVSPRATRFSSLTICPRPKCRRGPPPPSCLAAARWPSLTHARPCRTATYRRSSVGHCRPHRGQAHRQCPAKPYAAQPSSPPPPVAFKLYDLSLTQNGLTYRFCPLHAPSVPPVHGPVNHPIAGSDLGLSLGAPPHGRRGRGMVNRRFRQSRLHLNLFIKWRARVLRGAFGHLASIILGGMTRSDGRIIKFCRRCCGASMHHPRRDALVRPLRTSIYGPRSRHAHRTLP